MTACRPKSGPAGWGPIPAKAFSSCRRLSFLPVADQKIISADTSVEVTNAVSIEHRGVGTSSFRPPGSAARGQPGADRGNEFSLDRKARLARTGRSQVGGVWLSPSSELCLRAVNGSDCAKSDGVWVIGFVSGFVGTRTQIPSSWAKNV